VKGIKKGNGKAKDVERRGLKGDKDSLIFSDDCLSFGFD
jgi:hypothetical protein